MSTSSAVVKRAVDDALALMPPPPLKRIKRPPKVLDEDDYTDALTKIIERDYFPGLEESRAQNEYLAALESGNQAWIAEASQKVRAATSAKGPKPPRTERDQRYNTPSVTARGALSVTETPRGYDGSQTPMTVVSEASTEGGSATDISGHSLSSFQSKYTSEDNASFNDVLDNQNKVRREKHAYMWTEDQRIPVARQIAHRDREQRLLTEKESSDAEAAKNGEQALIPITTGAVDSRSAKPDAWKVKRPDNAFMFLPDSTSETDPTSLTIQEQKELDSKAGPKEIIYSNTRFPPLYSLASDPDPDPTTKVPASPSLNTDILANREAGTNTPYDGTSTPRVNGYAYVDEDEPDPTPQPPPSAAPSYRDLLAGQAPGPSPFHFSKQTTREALHHRLVEKTASAKRAKERDAIVDATPIAIGGGDLLLSGGTPANKKKKLGNITPAAARLLSKVGRTPVRSAAERAERMSSKDMWTPTPRRRVGK